MIWAGGAVIVLLTIAMLAMLRSGAQTPPPRVRENDVRRMRDDWKERQPW